MRYRELCAIGGASRLVQCYWSLELEAEDAGAIQRVVPDGRPELILHVGKPLESLAEWGWEIQPTCFLAGQITRPLLLRRQGPASIPGVRFRPQGAGAAFGLPMAGLCDRTTPIEDLSTRLWRSLEPVRESIRLDDWVVRLEREFASCVGRREDALIAEAVGRMERTRGLVEIGRLARDLGISSRQLERRFLKLVGLTPKVFCRMQRFQEVFRAIDENQPNWLEAALSAGYYDQAHLIRDFRDLAGEPPAALLNGNDLARHFLQRGDLSHFSKTCERDSV